jgi:hypothetical protein
MTSRLFGAFRASRAAIALLVLSFALAACEGVEVKEDAPPVDPRKYDRNSQPGDAGRNTVFGAGGLFSGGKKLPRESGSSGIGVNSFLWRASLDTVAFMPLSSADPFGGVIITDWYAPPETPNERFKMTVYILDRQLRADAIKVAVFRQRQSGGTWASAPVDRKTVTELENAILARARELRVAAGS